MKTVIQAPCRKEQTVESTLDAVPKQTRRLRPKSRTIGAAAASKVAVADLVHPRRSVVGGPKSWAPSSEASADPRGE